MVLKIILHIEILTIKIAYIGIITFGHPRKVLIYNFFDVKALPIISKAGKNFIEICTN